MFSWLKRKFKFVKMLSDQQQSQAKPKPEKIPENCQEIKEKLRDVFAECSDFHLREILLGQAKIKVYLAYIDNMANKQLLNDNILRPLMYCNTDVVAGNIMEVIRTKVINSAELTVVKEWNESIKAILAGDSAIYVDGAGTALAAGTKGWEARAVEEPETETVVRGPREGFVENIGVNRTMIRRKIKNPNLKMETMSIGRRTNTDVTICYVKGIADPEILNTVRQKLNSIRIDSVLESGYLEEYLEESLFSLFPTIGNSEKPDVVAGKLLEGRIAVLCDGTPFVLTVPFLFFEALQVSEDYYTRSVGSFLMRFLRISAFLISALLPAMYVSFLAFHQGVLPLKLLLTISASRQGLPFSPFTEALFMGLTFEILQEAGVRMPRPIGQAVSIVGALVIGEASVRAGLVSDPMIIITALTAISTFILPPLQRVLPYLRILFLIVANILGLLGVFLMLIVLLVYMCSLDSFGVPYTAPFAPLALLDLKDTFIRFPHPFMITRPRALTWQDERQDKVRVGLRFKTKGGRSGEN